jgi:hypothetical protein
MKNLAPVFAGVLLVLACASPSLANDKHPALPSRVFTARTVYVENQTTSAELQNVAYTELSKWGHFQIADSPQKADLVLRLSGGTFVRFVSGGENSSSTAAIPAKQNWASADQGVPDGSTRISLVDPKTGASLWSDIRKTKDPKTASHMLDGLRAAFDQKK